MIELFDVSKKFDDNVVFDNVSIRFERGKIHGIMGRNGMGKTVLLRLIIGLYYPDSGNIFVEGKRIGKDIEFAQNIGFIIETPKFLPNFTAVENLMFLARLSHKADINVVRTAISRVGLDPDSRKKVGKFSLGMRQRLGIAQAIMENPNLLILDEPTNALDKSGVKMVHELLRSFVNEGKTILLVTHIQSDMKAVCDELYELRDGKILRIEKEAVTANA